MYKLRLGSSSVFHMHSDDVTTVSSLDPSGNHGIDRVAIKKYF